MRLGANYKPTAASCHHTGYAHRHHTGYVRLSPPASHRLCPWTACPLLHHTGYVCLSPPAPHRLCPPVPCCTTQAMSACPLLLPYRLWPPPPYCRHTGNAHLSPVAVQVQFHPLETVPFRLHSGPVPDQCLAGQGLPHHQEKDHLQMMMI